MNILIAAVASTLCLVIAASVCLADGPTREEAVRERSADVMPFDVGATTHIFNKTSTGGIQRVVAKTADDMPQVEPIRAHLKIIADKFGRGDFGEPAHVHGAGMPGLVTLRSAKTGELKISYRDTPLGGEIEYSSSNPEIVAAVHDWFDAQLADHGPDASTGHDHTGHGQLQTAP
jgi:hypothetical protein